MQEFIQGQRKPAPIYHLVQTSGPDHSKQFTAEILVEGHALGRGTGKSKKIAEQEAAHKLSKKISPELINNY